jgi:hypothetical protein
MTVRVITLALTFLANVTSNKNVTIHCCITQGSLASRVTYCHCFLDGYGGPGNNEEGPC